MLDGLAGAPAFGARLGDGKETTVDGDLALAATGGAGDHLGAGSGTSAIAMRARGRTANNDLFFAALDGFQEIELQVVTEVGSLIGSGAPATSPSASAAKRILENIPEDRAAHATGTEDLAEEFEGVVKSTPGHAPSWGEGLVAEPVVRFALLGIGKNLVGLADFLELFLRLFIALVLVGVMLEGEFPVGFFDLLGRGAAGNPEDLVVILFGSHGSGGRRAGLGRADGDHAGRAEKSVAQFETTPPLVENGALRFFWGGFLAKRLVEMGIKRLADRVDECDSVIGEKTFELTLDELEAGDDRGDVLRGGGGLQAQFQVIEEGKEV